jgi:hypothetical protein
MLNFLAGTKTIQVRGEEREYAVIDYSHELRQYLAFPVLGKCFGFRAIVSRIAQQIPLILPIKC